MKPISMPIRYRLHLVAQSVGIGAEAQGWNNCGNGAWISEYDSYSGQIWANYVTANGSGRSEECDGLGHYYHTSSDHYITINGSVTGFDIARSDP